MKQLGKLKRNVPINFYVTAAEKTAIDKECKRSGTTVSSLVRDILLSKLALVDAARQVYSMRTAGKGKS